MASSSSPKGVVVTVPVLVLSLAAAAIFLFFLLSSLSSCSCPSGATTTSVGGGNFGGGEGSTRFKDQISTSKEDIEWVQDQIRANRLQMQENVLRKGINPRTRAQQLEDLKQ